VDALLQYLHVESADVFGFSNGAGNALQLAIRHPSRVHKLIFASYMTKKAGAPSQFWEFMGSQANFSNMPQPLKDAFLKVNPDQQRLRTMCEKDIDRMRHFKDVPIQELKSVRAPTLILLGDRDVPKLEHAVELSREIAGARLLVLPGGHGEYLGELLTMKPGSGAPELTARHVEEFLGSP
jgi:pimeloyl-ACP methyl ester carboxylesterase